MSKWSDLYQQSEAQHQGNAQLSVTNAVEDNPDDAARAAELAEASGVPASVIYPNIEAFERTHRATLASQIVAGNPHLQDYVNSHPLAAKVSNDDYAQLDVISRHLNHFQEPKSARAAMGLAEDQPEPSHPISEAVITGFKAGFNLEGMQEEYQQLYNYVDSPWWRSFVQNSGFGGAAVTLAAAPRMFNALVYGSSAGISEVAKQSGMSESDANRLTRDLIILGQVGMSGQSIMGIPSESIKVVNDAARLGRTVKPYIDAGKEPPAGLHPVIDDAKKEMLDLDHDNLKELQKESDKSATLERSPEMYRQFLEQKLGDTKFEIGAEAVRKLYGDEVPSPEDGKLGFIPNLAEQLAAAEGIGGDIEISRVDWLTRLEPELRKELIDDLRIRPGGLTKNEAKELKTEETVGEPHDMLRRATALEPVFAKDIDKKLTLQRTEEARQSATGSGRTFHNFDLVDEQGKALGNLDISQTGDHKALIVEHIGGILGEGEQPNIFGTSLVRSLLQQVKTEFPEAETLEGTRVSGARIAAKGEEGTAKVVINLKDIDDWTKAGGIADKFAELTGGQVYEYGLHTQAYIKDFENLTPEERAKIEAVNAEISRIVPKQVDVQPASGLKMGGSEPRGAYIQYKERLPLLLWSLDAPDPFNTGRHEALHHLRRMGFFTKEEWATLMEAAIDGDWVKNHNIEARYPELKLTDKIEEAIAEEFARWRGGAKAEGRLHVIFEKLKGLIEQIKSALGKYKLTAENLFDMADAGVIGKREGGQPLHPEAFRPAEQKVTIPSEDVLRDAGFSDYEIRRMERDPDPTKMRQVREGYTYINGDWKKVTQEEVDKARAIVEQNESAKAVDKEKLDKAFEAGGMPHVSSILGSDWQPGNLAPERYKEAAYAALDRKYAFAQRQLAKYERILERTKAEPIEPAEQRPMAERDIFSSPAAAGMTKDRMERYLASIEKQRKEDLDAQQERILKREKTRQTKEWKERKAALRPEVTDSIRGRPDVAAHSFFYDGTLHGSKLSEKPKLSSHGLTDEQRVALKDIISKDGVDPDDVSGLFGYSSGKELVQRLSDLEGQRKAAGMRPVDFIRRVVDAEVDRQLEQRYGKLDENILEDVKDQLFSDTQLDLLHEETLHMAELAKAELPISAEDLQLGIKEEVARLNVSQVNSDKFMNLIRKAGNGLEDALLKKDFAEAFRLAQLKQKAFLYAKEAKRFEKAKDQFDKTAKQFRKREVPNVDQYYTNAIHSILMRVGEKVNRLGSDLAEEIAASPYDSLRDFVEKQENQVFGMRQLDVADFLFDENYKTPVKNMTVREFEGLKASIDTLAENGRDEKMINVAGEKRDKAAVKAEMIAKLQTFPKHETPATEGRVRKALKLPKSYIAAGVNFETLLNRWDRNDPTGIFNQVLVRQMTEGANTKARIEREVAKAYGELPKIKDLKKLIPSPLMEPDGSGPVTGFTKENALVILQNYGNASNWKSFTKGWDIKPEVLEQWLFDRTVDGTLTRDDWNRAKGLGSIFEDIWAKEKRAYRERNRTAPESIQIGKIKTPFGEKDGWYHPLIADKTREGKGKAQRGGAVYDDADYGHANTNNGFTKRRTGAEYPVALNFSAIPSRLSQMIHDLALRDAVINAEKILNDSEFRAAVTRHYGEEYKDGLMPYLRGVAGGASINSAALTQAARVSEFLRQNTISAYIGFNIYTALKHGPTALMLSMKQVGPTRFLDAIGHLYGKSPDITLNNREFVDKWSEEVGRRKRHWQETIVGQQKETFGPGTTREKIIEAGSWMVAQSDMMSVRPTWLAAYTKAIEEGKDHGQSVFEGDRAVRRAHGSTAITNLPLLVSGGGPLHGWLTTLYGFFGTMMQRRMEIVYALNDAYRMGKQGEIKQAGGHMADVLTGFMTYVVIPTMIEEYVTGLTTDDRRGWGSHLLMGTAAGLGSSMLYVRDIVSSLVTGHEPSVGLITSPIHDVRNLFHQLGKGRKMFSKQEVGKTVSNFITVFGEATGMAPKEVGNVARFSLDVHSGQQRPRSITDWRMGTTRGGMKKRVQR